jgi:hypothetical protein
LEKTLSEQPLSMRSGYIPRTDGYGTVRRLEFGKSLQGLREFF